MRMLHVPSEAPDEIAVWLPETHVLLSAEVIQGPTFPNMHTLRGAAFRDPVKWFKSIDTLREFHASDLVPAHGPPVSGADKVEEVLRMYRDGIQFVHDQTVRYMNHGLTPDELVEVVKLPPHLDRFKPYLRQYYGTVKHSVREIYVGYLGWFDGDPVNLDPIAPVERSRRLVALMGGRDRVLDEARKAFTGGDNQWAAELAGYLIRLNHGDLAARTVKANAFRRMAYASINTNWRNWYLVAAHELEGTLDPALPARSAMATFSSPDLIAALPARAWVEGFTTRLKAENTLDTHMTAGFRFPDVNEAYALEIRRGVAQFHNRLPERTDLTIALDKRTLDQMLLGKLTLPDAFAAGTARIEQGTAAEALKFFGYFERPFAAPIQLTVR